MDNYKKRIIKLIESESGKTIDDNISLNNCNLIDDLNFDSISIISFFEIVEQEFNIKLEPEDMLECINSVRRLIEILEER